jgi:hypothetical protein
MVIGEQREKGSDKPRHRSLKQLWQEPTGVASALHAAARAWIRPKRSTTMRSITSDELDRASCAA